ncbi:MAG: single-stranded-DNA-specific exonuclease RecJ [Flavobacteriales bacterium]|nr:MAG: single-stranded-DNA-specific exonuclease RecJ [Flavobacteriales bacterium]
MRWTLKPEPHPKKVAVLAKALKVETILAKLLIQRGITTYDEAKAFFRPSLEDLHDPFLMKNMVTAVERVFKALEQGEHILVYGDYDVDGTTAVTLMAKYLKSLGGKVATYIPDRENEGYGISFQGIDFAHDNDCTLMIALDCGIKAVDKIAYANECGVDVIICDHHTPGKVLPEAMVILNPKQADCGYPYKELSGCGIGFKLIQALHRAQEKPVEELKSYLDLVATSIAADIVPITGENRVLAYFGLQVINQKPSIGIQALKSELQKDRMSITDVVFQIAPRINAAGRLKHAHYAVDLLMSDDTAQAQTMAKAIGDINDERKSLDQYITGEALSQIEQQLSDFEFSTVVYNPEWHKGVVGIVASRLIENRYRPTVVLTKANDELLVGSARSVKGFDLYEALEQCSDYIEQFGGHKYAAGLRILPENLDKFRHAFENAVKSSIKAEDLEPEITVDSEMFLSDISHKFYRIIEQMAPFGPGNMRPVFMASGLKDNGYSRTVGQDHSHLKLSIVEGANPKTYNGIAFGMGESLPLVKQTFKAVSLIFTDGKASPML